MIRVPSRNRAGRASASFNDLVTRLENRPKRTKYHSQLAIDDMALLGSSLGPDRGVIYDSQLEREVAYRLELKRQQGLIARWAWGPRFVLQRDPDRPGTLITYRPDFVIWPVNGPWYALDAKGMRQKAFQLKARLWKIAYPDHALFVVGKDSREVPA